MNEYDHLIRKIRTQPFAKVLREDYKSHEGIEYLYVEGGILSDQEIEECIEMREIEINDFVDFYEELNDLIWIYDDLNISIEHDPSKMADVMICKVKKN